MRKTILAMIAAIAALASQSAEWPEALDDCDIIFRVEEIYTGYTIPIPGGWGQCRFYTPNPIIGLKNGDSMSTGWVVLSGNTAGNSISITTGGATTNAYRKLLFTSSGDRVTGYTVLGYYKDSAYSVPDDGTSEAFMDDYANLEDGYNVIGGTYPPSPSTVSPHVSASYSDSKITLGPGFASPTVSVSAVGTYYAKPEWDKWYLITVLKYKNLAPQLQKSSENAYNGKNYIFYAKDFFIDPLSTTTYTSTNVTPHASVSYQAALNAYLVNLGTSPVNSKIDAVYKLKATNGYGSYEANITFHLYPSSLLIEPESGGNTDPGSGLVGGEPGDGVTVTCTPDETHEFVKWIGSAVTVDNETDNPINVVLTDEQLTLKPQYEEIPYVERCDLLLSFNPNKGVLKVNDQDLSESSSLRLEKGTLVKIQATPKTGYEFTSWDGDMSAAFKEDDYVEFYLNETKDISAIFDEEAEEEEETGTSTTVTTIGTGGSSSSNVMTFDKAALDALLKNSSNSTIGTRTGSTSFTASSPFGTTSTMPSSSPTKSYSSDYSISGDRGDGSSSALKSGGSQGGNIHDVQQLKNNKGYYFKYKAYEGDAYSGGEGMQTYYSTDEVEQYRNTGGVPPTTIISNLMNLIQGK